MTEVLVVFILFVLAPLAVFYGIRLLREGGGGSRDADARDTMRRSELERMIHDAVLDATAPLEARIDDLERDLLLGEENEGRIAPEALAEAFAEPLAEDEAEEGRRRERA